MTGCLGLPLDWQPADSWWLALAALIRVASGQAKEACKA